METINYRTKTIRGSTYYEAEINCAECGKLMELRPSRYGLFYGCTGYPACNGTHGAHPDGQPLGTPASKEVKLLRMRAHELFDKMWKEDGLTRKQSYRWLQDAMQMTQEEAHIGKFGKEECQRLIRVLEAVK